MNKDIILKAEDLYFSYDDETFPFPKRSHAWRSDEDRRLPLWAPMAVRKIHLLSVLHRHPPPLRQAPCILTGGTGHI